MNVALLKYIHAVTLPVNLKKDLGINDGDQVIFIKNSNSWMITTRLAWIKDAQAHAKTINPENNSLVNNLIKERRKIAKLESI